MKPFPLLLAVLLFGIGTSCTDRTDRHQKALEELDRIIERRDTYGRTKNLRIAARRDELAAAKDPRKRIALAEEIYKEYYNYDIDSAYHYARRMLALAQSYGDGTRINWRTGLSGQNRSQRRHVRRSLPHPASGRHDPSGAGKQERILQRLPLLPLQTALRRRSRAQSPLPRFAAILQRAAHPQSAGRLRPAQGARSHDVLQGGGSPQGAGSAPARIRSRHRRHAPAGDGRLPAGAHLRTAGRRRPPARST